MAIEELKGVFKGRLAVLGAVAVAWFTVLAWAIPAIGREYFGMSGESGMVFIIFLPLLIPGVCAAGVITQLFKLQPEQHPALAQTFAVVCTIVANAAIAWAFLSLASSIIAVVRRRVGSRICTTFKADRRA